MYKLKIEQFNDLVMTQRDIAIMLGVSATTIKEWKLNLVREKNKVYINVIEAISERLQQLTEQSKSNNNALSSSKTRLADSQARKNEIEVAKVEVNLIEFDLMSRILNNLLAIHRSNLFTNNRTVSKELIDIDDEHEIEKILNKFTNTALDDLQKIDRSIFVDSLLEEEGNVDKSAINKIRKSPKRISKKSKAAKRTKRK